MFENIESKNAIEARVVKGEVMGVPHRISMFENFVFKLDAIWVFLRRCAGPEVQDKFVPLPENRFEVGADWVGDVIGSDRTYLFLDKDRHVILDSVGAAAPLALPLAPTGTQCAVTGRAANNIGNAFIHSS